jgi:hypothetical protein
VRRLEMRELVDPEQRRKKNEEKYSLYLKA